jgi:hypothetical protein
MKFFESYLTFKDDMTFFERYMYVIATIHKDIPKYPTSSKFRSGNHPAYRVRELCNTLAFTEAFEEKIKTSDDPLLKGFARHPSLMDRGEKIRQDIKFLLQELAKKGYSFEPLNEDGIPDAQPAALAYAEYIRMLKGPEEILAHFYANTHALLFDSGNLKGTFPQKIDPAYKKTNAGMTFCYLAGIDCEQFEQLLAKLDSNSLNEVKFTKEQAEMFLHEIGVVYKTLFHQVFQAQEKWCKENQDVYLSPGKSTRTWAEVSDPSISSVTSRLKWALSASFAANVGVNFYSAIAPGFR